MREANAVDREVLAVLDRKGARHNDEGSHAFAAAIRRQVRAGTFDPGSSWGTVTSYTAAMRKHYGLPVTERRVVWPGASFGRGDQGQRTRCR